MKEEYAIEVHNIRKSFRVYPDKGHSLKEKALFSKRNKFELKQVIDGISFAVKRGEAIGLVGYNGCGKSTTLKMLTKIIYPDSGEIITKGRVSSLLELGAGFHPDMSGRDNIYINASIFGLTRKEIDARIDDIIEFSELEEFIDNPVRTYSSGMYMRLAFSVAINVNADILLVDEILAVGDVNFQAKCFNKMMEIKGKGTTIVIVSHSTGQIEQICERSIWIHKGKIKAEGAPKEVHRQYLTFMGEQRNIIAEKAEIRREDIVREEKKDAKEEYIIKIDEINLLDSEGKGKRVFQVGESICVTMVLTSKHKISEYYLEANLVRADGMFCYGASTAADGMCVPEINNKLKVVLNFDCVNLLAGKYHFDLHIASGTNVTIQFIGNAAEFEIMSFQTEGGLVHLDHQWQMENRTEA